MEQDIINARPEHAAAIASFQISMALETEHVKLNAELVNKAVTYFLSLHSEEKESHMGFYLVKLVGEEVVGSIMVTY
jgi:hypothetical protein